MKVLNNGWFIMEKTNQKWMITGGTPISGNLQVTAWYCNQDSTFPSPRSIANFVEAQVQLLGVAGYGKIKGRMESFGYLWLSLTSFDDIVRGYLQKISLTSFDLSHLTDFEMTLNDPKNGLCMAMKNSTETVLQPQTLRQVASDVAGLVMLKWFVASSNKTLLDAESLFFLYVKIY